MSVAKAWGSSVHGCSVFLRFFTHMFPIILHFLLSCRVQTVSCRLPVASFLVLRHRSVCGQLACLIQTPGTVGVLGYPLPPPLLHQHALPPPLTHKDISCRGNLAPLSHRRVSPSPELPCLWRHMCIFLKSHVILFTWCFSFILDQSKRKRLPFSGIIPYAQTPKGSHLFLNFTNCFYQLLFVRFRMRPRVYHLSAFVWTCRVI